MGFLFSLIIGGVAGWLASIVMKTNKQQGLIMDIIVGLIGGLIGGFVFSILPLNAPGGIIGQIIVAFVGAVILLWIVRRIRK